MKDDLKLGHAAADAVYAAMIEVERITWTLLANVPVLPNAELWPARPVTVH
jgi:hypothetical protein